MERAPVRGFLEDEAIELRLLEEDDLEGAYRYWFNNKVVTRGTSHGRFPKSCDELREYIKCVSESKESLVLAICIKGSGEHVGNIALQRISWIDRSCELACIIGDACNQGKGLMKRAATLLLDHAFLSLNLMRVACGTVESNVGMKKLATRLNMQLEGKRRSAIYKEGLYLDILEYGLLREEWLEFRGLAISSMDMAKDVSC